MNLGLQHKTIAITGATRGIGRAIAEACADEGANVAICGRTPSTLREAAAALQAKGVQVHAEQVDVVAPDGVERFIETSARSLGRIDGVVANVGGSFGGRDFLSTAPEDWVKTLEVNLIHAVRLIRAAAPHLTASGAGSALIISSISATRPSPRPHYGASKAAEVSLAMALGRELAPSMIRVNSLSPGSIMFEGGSWAKRAQEMPALISDFIAREFPWKRMGTPEEVAQVAAFLLSPRASWVSGTDIIVDGAQNYPSVHLPSVV